MTWLGTSGNMNQTNNADAFQSNPVACPSLNDLATGTDKTLVENYGAVSNFHRIHCKTKDCQFETESNFDDDNFCHEVNEKILPILLEVWAVQNCITHNALRDLLCLLHKLHPNLPKDPRTLFSLSYEFTIDNTAGGQYYHFGIASTLSHQFQLKLYSKINLQLNIDGLPLFKSSDKQLWPILALTEENHKFEMHIQPFVIGVYAGDRKPCSAVDYLKQFVDEMKKLEEDGFELEGKKYIIQIRRKLMKISSVLTGLQKAIPAEFARKPRSLSELARWKATEFRQFLLYTGIVVLKNNVHESIYKNFLLLSMAICILTNEKIVLLKMNLPILF